MFISVSGTPFQGDAADDVWCLTWQLTCGGVTRRMGEEGQKRAKGRKFELAMSCQNGEVDARQSVEMVGTNFIGQAHADTSTRQAYSMPNAKYNNFQLLFFPFFFIFLVPKFEIQSKILIKIQLYRVMYYYLWK